MARRTKADAEATRSSLLDAAQKLFQQKGVSRTSLQEIASAAGTTRGAIYWHFKDKGDLFNAMLERVTWPLQEPLQRAAASATPDNLLELRTVYLDGIRYIVQDKRARCVLDIAIHKVEYTEDMGAVRARHLASHQEGVEYNHRVLETAQSQMGRPLTIPVATAALGLHALFVGLVQQWILDPSAYDLLENGTASIDAFLRGIGLEIPCE